RFMGYRNVVDLPIAGERDGHVTLEAPDMRLVGVRKLPLDGKHAAVAMRPEEIAIATEPAASNVIAARVDHVEYGGRDSLVEVVTAGGKRLHLRSSTKVAAGANVYVHVPPERVLVYPSEAGAS
ncbi:MAG TPA: TOBE domain-containing protein, partial [Casimicrobiaceae bacterium]|nr:TOBE domain-containing protein [Casimicrobiaceae bacterium]